MRDAVALLPFLSDPNVIAFLRLIRAGESTQDESAYRLLFGSTKANPKLFDSFDDHPRVRTYETYDGQFIKNGKIDYTTAAGAYQIVETTWNAVAARLGLRDFSPKNQDLAALSLIDGRAALDDVLAGNIDRAMFKCRNEWASLPGSEWGQPTQAHDKALAVYRDAGGLFTPSAGEGQTVANRETQIPSKETPVIAAAPFLWSLASTLIDAFTPLAKEKITKEVARHTDSPEVADQVASSVIEAAKNLTGKSDPLEAVVAAKNDPAVMQAIEGNALENLAKLAPVLDKIAEWDKNAWAAEESSRDAAAARALANPANDQDVFLTRSIVALLVGLLVTIGVLIGVLVWLKADAGTIGTLVGLFASIGGVVVGKFGTRYDHRYGSSRSSGAKDAVISELSRRPQ